MKSSPLLMISALLLTSCATAHAPSIEEHAFGETADFEINDTVTFEGGLTLQLISINDSRCPADVQCIWAGELSADFELGGTTQQELTLGQSTSPSVTLEDYTFELTKITESSAAVTVTQNR